MDIFQLRLLVLLVLLHGAACTNNTTEVIGAVGGSVTFRVPNPAGKPMFWNFGDDSIATVLVRGTPEAVFADEKYKKRFSFPENGSALSISQLALEDAGIYSVTVDGKRSDFILHVFRELAEPRVSCEARNCSAGSCRFSLRCSVPGAGLGNVSYSWSRGEEPWGEGPTVLLGNGSAWKEPESLTCTARNRVSARNVTVVAPGDLCSENAQHPPGPGAFSHSWAGIGVGGGIGIVVLLSIVLLLLLWKSKDWRKFHLSTEKPMDTEATACTTVYAEVGRSQQRIPNGIKAKPAGAPDSCSTVYSLVKRPDQEDNGKAENATMGVLELV